MQIVYTQNAPDAIGPYSQALVHADIVYTSGQIPIDPKSGEIAGTTIEQQAEQALRNLSAILVAADSSLDLVVKTTCFLSDMDLFTGFNSVYEKFITKKPARSCVAVRSLPKNVLVEIEAIALTNKP